METVAGHGARICVCRLKKERQRMIDRIPPRFANSRINALVPDVSKHEKQAKFIPVVKANPTASYFLAGSPGTGKSMLMWALYRHAVETGTSRVIACTLSELLDEFRAFIRSSVSGEDPKMPRLSVHQLRQNDRKYSIFLDDIDKANPTDYAAEQVFGIVNAVYEFQHQLVVTTNKSPQQLIAQYDKSFDRGEPIVRRMMEGAKVMEMF